MKKSIIALAGVLASIQCTHADILPVPDPIDLLSIIAFLAVALLICAGAVYAIYRLYRHLRPGKKIQMKETAAKKKQSGKKK